MSLIAKATTTSVSLTFTALIIMKTDAVVVKVYRVLKGNVKARHQINGSI